MDKTIKVEDFLKKSTVLVVDRSNNSRKGIVKFLTSLGVNYNNIFAASSIGDAKEIYNNKTPQLVISDYYISGGSGFELFQHIKSIIKNDKDVILTLMTSNATQTVVAKAAEEDVDSYILKPYNLETVTRILNRAIQDKHFPSDYLKKVQEGKELLFSGKIEESLVFFDEAIDLSNSPSLALSYKGQALTLLEQINEAEDTYQEGLNFNKIHYKCLSGLYSLYKELDKSDDAFSVAKNLLNYFPCSNDRFCEILHLAVKTKNYSEIPNFHQSFIEIDDRPLKLKNYMTAALFITGKNFIRENEFNEAYDCFGKLVTTSHRDPEFLKKIIKQLVFNEKYEEARLFLQKFAPNDMLTNHFAVASYLAEFDQLDSNERVKGGLEIFNTKNRDYDAFKFLYEELIKSDLEKKANTIKQEALKYWPDIKKINNAA